MSKKKSRRERAKSGKGPARNRGPSVAQHRSADNGQNGQRISFDQFTVSEILTQRSLLGFFETNGLQALLCQVALLSVVTAGAGTLISKFVPDPSESGVGHGVYVGGVLLLLLIETAYQWLLRSAVLSIEKGALILGRERFPHISDYELRSVLQKNREDRETKLKRLFEPIQRVGLIAVGLSILFVAQRTGGETPPTWVEVLSKDWAMTLMFGLAGFLWQLKNPDNIGKLLEHLKIQRHVTFFGERFWVVGLVCPTLGSMFVICWWFWPWGVVSIAPLIMAFCFVGRYLERQSSQ